MSRTASPDRPFEHETVGTFLADIANLLSDGLRILYFADKTHWGPDEHEQVLALDDALDDAKKDFQELAPLVKGQLYYENDRRRHSLDELRELRTKLNFHIQNFRDWTRAGGPINPVWARETAALKRELHRAQCRAAARIYAGQQEDHGRCLGAYQIYRLQRQRAAVRTGQGRGRAEQAHARRRSSRRGTGAGAAHGRGDDGDTSLEEGRELRPTKTNSLDTVEAVADAQSAAAAAAAAAMAGEALSEDLKELVAACNDVGRFERFGEAGIAFVCDFCDGFLVWEDLDQMPSARASASAADSAESPNWRATGRSVETGQDKGIVFAPLAVANHIRPDEGRWEAGILCPYCDDHYDYAQGDGELERVRYDQDEAGYVDMVEFQEHLEWHHAPVGLTSLQSTTSGSSCAVM